MGLIQPPARSLTSLHSRATLKDTGRGVEAESINRLAVVIMTITTTGCPASDMIPGGVKQRLEDMEGADEVESNVVWDPRWSPQVRTFLPWLTSRSRMASIEQPLALHSKRPKSI